MKSRFALLGFTFAVMLAGCQEKPKEIAKQDRPVLVQEVAFETRVQERTFVATIRPRVETDLGFRVPGKVARRLVNVGDAVMAGQPLMVLDATDLRLQAEQAEAENRAADAALAQAGAELGRLSALRGLGWSTAAAFDRQNAAVSVEFWINAKRTFGRGIDRTIARSIAKVVGETFKVKIGSAPPRRRHKRKLRPNKIRH